MESSMFALFTRATERLSYMSDELAEVYAARLHRTSAMIGDAASAIARKDVDHAMGLLGPNASLHGIDLQSSVRTFDHTQVLSIPLLGPNNELLGFSFPKEHKDLGRMARWVGMQNRTSDRGFHLIRPEPPIWGDAPHWVWDDAPQRAPWCNPDDPARPIYEHVHANPQQFGVVVNTGIDQPELTLVKVDGTTFARITAENDLFRRAARENPRGDLVLTGCRAGTTAAKLTAEYLHNQAGFDRTIHAFKNDVQHDMLADYDGGSSRLGVKATTDAAGNAMDAVTSFSPPSRSSPTSS